MAVAYPYGLIDFELNTDVLRGSVIELLRFSAIMQNGYELSMPGNCTLLPLDVKPALAEGRNEITVSLAVPRWSRYEANQVEASSTAKRLYTTHKSRIPDENTGDNEISLITRRINARLVTDSDDVQDMITLPVLKLHVMSHGDADMACVVNERFIPPWFAMTNDCPIKGIIGNLLVDMRSSKDKIQDALVTERFTPEQFTGAKAHDVLVLSALAKYETRLTALLAAELVSPFEYYLELSSLLADLSSYFPVNSIKEMKRYDHDDLEPVFDTLVKDVRSFLSARGGVGYSTVVFESVENGLYYRAPVKTEYIGSVKTVYLAVKTEHPEADVVKELEDGDKFKLISPAGRTMRARGIKLSYCPYPPRFLPVLRNTLWFKLELEESARVWREICEEKAMLIDYASVLFHELEAALYIVQGDA
jgi:type VI secretion system ImpJ/VasE family protein